MISKTKKKLIKERIEQIKSDMAYNNAPGTHTYNFCSKCNKYGTRTGHCNYCLQETIDELNKQLKEK